MKEVAPSTDLRRWYHVDLSRWADFRKRYKAELIDRQGPAHAALAGVLPAGTIDPAGDDVDLGRRFVVELPRGAGAGAGAAAPVDAA